MTKIEEQKTGKSPYHSPRLLDYGDIREITQSAGANGVSDNGAPGPNNTTR